MTQFRVQIDVKEIKKGWAICNLYTGKRCIEVVMPEKHYHELMQDGFFIRDGKERDSANVLNTTDVFTNKSA
ncbi:MAG: hypothetical protein N4A71_11000 [Carboxylicivirga sp.]|jgi:hypothetical protein|nr:hypothetical protein [Carboxylicivirga sp.]